MAAGHVNQALLESNYQNPGEIYLDTKTEGAFQVLANQINDNYDASAGDITLITGPNGSQNVGSPAIPLSVPAGTVYSQLTFLENQIQSLVGGSIPVGTITEAMLSTDLQSKIAVIQQNQREIARLKMESDIKNRVDGVSYVYYDNFGGLQSGSIGTIDRNKANVTSGALSAGATSCTVTAGHGFVTGQEVTFQDVVTQATREVKVVTVSGNNLTFTALTNAYAANALLYRSLVFSDTINSKGRFDLATFPSAVTAAGTTVAATGTTTTSGQGRLVQLDNGWLITSNQAGTVHRSIDGGQTWAQLCTNTAGSALSDNGTIFSIGNMVFQLIMSNATVNNYLYRIDPITQTNVDIKNTTAYPLPSPITTTNPNIISIAPGDDKSIVVAIWSQGGTTSSYVYSSTDFGATWTPLFFPTAGTSNQSISGIDVLSKNEFVFGHFSTTSGATTSFYYKNGVVTLGQPQVATAGNQNMQFLIKRTNSNIGRVVVAYRNSSGAGITYTYSDDGGAIYAAAATIGSSGTVGNVFPALKESTNGDIHAVWQDSAGVRTATMPNGTNVFGASTSLELSGVSPSCHKKVGTFTVMPHVYTNGATQKFRATHTATLGINVLNADLRYNITPPGNVDTIVSWVERDDFAGFSTNALASIVAPGGNETYFALSKTTSAAFSGKREDQFTGSDGSNTKVNLKVTMTRANVADDKGIYSITGAVGV